MTPDKREMLPETFMEVDYQPKEAMPMDPGFMTPINVREIPLDIGKLPSWAEMLNDLPIGVGFKGGIARKILKVICGLGFKNQDFASEMNGEGDVDILIAVQKVTPGLRLELRQKFHGYKLGEMTLDAKDIEVEDDLCRYFRTRDVTINECLVFRRSKEEYSLFFTEEALSDARVGVIRPSIHVLHQGFKQVWMWDDEQNVIVAEGMLVRAIIRYIKGHGKFYGIDDATWVFYQQRGLSLKGVFQVLRPFHDNDEMFFKCFRHLVHLELVPEHIDSNKLWGAALNYINDICAHAFGGRFTLTPLDAEGVERWMARKQHEYLEWLERRASLEALGLEVEPDIEAQVTLPAKVSNFPAFYT